MEGVVALKLELGLGLSLGGFKMHQVSKGGGQFARILTSKDFPSVIPAASPSSSSSSSF
ncbi:hypothetical protein F3Y22_tig00110332pilonHSYRG01390 [Hibiscus syriacus]|uniref:Uncharacterized protein n=1 Tax=Hibiscus syriacus TaxID=106335 RepID=A0A6A3B0G1_HIBSY|nr:hypothetical protein F3Y22_tig00110332pilonHSYRG01390 [Hibiscus syriacus]